MTGTLVSVSSLVSLVFVRARSSPETSSMRVSSIELTESVRGELSAWAVALGEEEGGREEPESCQTEVLVETRNHNPLSMRATG